jgi:hypothetical protein
VLQNWDNSLLYEHFPKQIEDLRVYILEELEKIAIRDPGRIRRVENRQIRHEESFSLTQPRVVPTATNKEAKNKAINKKINNKKDTEPRICLVCGLSNHKTVECYHYQPGKPIQELKTVLAQKKLERSSKYNACVTRQPERTGGRQLTTTIGIAHVNLGLEVKTQGRLELELGFSATTTYTQCGVRPDEIDFILDSGTETGVTNTADATNLQNIVEDKVIIRGVTGDEEVKLIGDGIFGRTRIVPSFQKRSTLVTDREFGNYYQMVNPMQDVVDLVPWDKDSRLPTWRFTRDPERYQDHLLHCTILRDKCVGVRHESVDSSYTFYQPADIPIRGVLTHDDEVIGRVERVHTRFNHASAQAMDRLVQREIDNDNNVLNITSDDIKLWKIKRGDHCPGCISGKLKEHNRVASTKIHQVIIGNVAADIMYIQVGKTVKASVLVVIDMKCKLIMVKQLENDTAYNIGKAFNYIEASYVAAGHKLLKIYFDREPGVVALQQEFYIRNIEIILTAAGQHVGLVEVTIRYIKETARATKAGVRDLLGYTPPDSWNMDLIIDAVRVMNRLIHVGESKTPQELFTGREIDLNRDMRAYWGEIVLVKRRKGLASGLGPNARWAVIVGREMNGTGILKVYVVETKRYAHILNFRRARVPEWVIVELNDINPDSIVRYEEDDMTSIERLNDETFDDNEPVLSDRLVNAMNKVDSDNATSHDHTAFIDSYHDANVMNEVTDNTMNDGEDINMNDNEPEISREVRDLKYLARDLELSSNRSARMRRAPEYYTISNYMSLMLFEQAAKLNPEHADSALNKEIDSIEKMNVWEGRHIHDLSVEERALIIDNMKNFIDKWHPDGTFEKYKARVLVRGDHQVLTGSTEAPVCRVHSIFTIINLSLLYDMDVMKIDIKSAFLNTPMPDDVKHKWVLLDKVTSNYLVKKNHNKWHKYMNDKGRILVEMKKLMYGYKEAAHYWQKYLFTMFKRHNYKVCVKDQCVAILRDNKSVVMIAVTVDDCFIACTPDMKMQVIKMFENEFGEITVETGDDINIIGMSIHIDRNIKSAKIQQKHYVSELRAKYGVTTTAKTPHTSTLFESKPDDELLVDQLGFMSLNASCMYAANRTYPENLLTTGYLSTKYYHATVIDEKKALRMIEYMGNDDEHCLYFRPKSTRAISAADSSYAEHDDAKSHTGGCVGMEGHDDNHAYYIFICNKQPIVAKSSCECELIAQSTVGDYVVWLNDFLDELGYRSSEPALMYQDNTSAIRISSQGTGTFKRSKHIKVRFFWLKELVELGELIFQYISTNEMVADILTKPLTGALFIFMLKKLLGYNARPK